MVDAAKDAAEQGEQPRPGRAATLEDLFGIRPQLHSQAGDGVEGVVARILADVRVNGRHQESRTQ
jgi:hypothetical protein